MDAHLNQCFSHQVCCLPHPVVVPVPPHLLFYSDYVSCLTGYSCGWTLPFPLSVFHITISLNQLWLCLVSVSQHFLRCGAQTPWADTALWLTRPFPLFHLHLHTLPVPKCASADPALCSVPVVSSPPPLRPFWSVVLVFSICLHFQERVTLCRCCCCLPDSSPRICHVPLESRGHMCSGRNTGFWI